jgi:ribosome production factor 1
LIEEEEEKKDEEVSDDDDDEEIEEEEENIDPKILITTNDMTISFKTYKFCRELARVLPNGHYFYRKNIRLGKIIPEAIKREYSALITVNEDHKVPSKINFNFSIIC